MEDMKRRRTSGCGVNARLPGDKCVYLDVMLGKSRSSLLQNDLVLIKSKSKCEQKIREHEGNMEMQLRGEPFQSTYSPETAGKKEQETQTNIEKKIILQII